MNVLIVSGIWPPDVGGPASHAPEVASYLLAHGHLPRALVTADAPPSPEAYPVEWVDRNAPPGILHLRALTRVFMLARKADVVYTTGMFGRSGAGALVARRPYVVKLTADPAFERARRRGFTAASLSSFQEEATARTLPFRIARDAIARRAAHIVTPSAYLRELAIGWGVPAERVTILPNPAPLLLNGPSRDTLRARFGMTAPTLVFAGRLVPQKSLEIGIEAARRAGVDLVVAGNGPERARLEAIGHARFLGPLAREDVLALFQAGDASLLSSSWENFPHGVVESLAAGTPVVATRVGGVAELVRDGENGLLVEPRDVNGMAAAIRRIVSEPGLLTRLRAAAGPSVAEYAPDRIYGRLVEILAESCR